MYSLVGLKPASLAVSASGRDCDRRRLHSFAANRCPQHTDVIECFAVARQ